MGGWLFVASLLLTVSTVPVLRWAFRGRNPARTYRGAVLAGGGLTVSVWLGPFTSGEELTPTAGLLTAAGAIVGGVVATAASVGLVEDNAPPPVAVRERLLRHHSSPRFALRSEPRTKRALDISAASVGLVVTLPLWVLVSCLIWIEEPGPILFTKNVVGRGGTTFRQFKFRSMRYEAERLTGPVASPAGDNRMLRCGRWFRRWHFDELPELINVLTGTMSLVGPRPLRAVLVDRYLDELPEFAERHTVRPGIACIAQIQKYHISPAERLRKDRVYLRRMSVGFDLRMLCLAVTTTLRGPRPDGEQPMVETVPAVPGVGGPAA